MTEYEHGRRDAIRDVITYLMIDVRSRYYESEPEHGFIARSCAEIEKLTAVEPDGSGRVWPVDMPNALSAQPKEPGL